MNRFKLITQKIFDEIDQFQKEGELIKLSQCISKIVKNF